MENLSPAKRTYGTDESRYEFVTFLAFFLILPASERVVTADELFAAAVAGPCGCGVAAPTRRDLFLPGLPDSDVFHVVSDRIGSPRFFPHLRCPPRCWLVPGFLGERRSHRNGGQERRLILAAGRGAKPGQPLAGLQETAGICSSECR